MTRLLPVVGTLGFAFPYDGCRVSFEKSSDRQRRDAGVRWCLARWASELEPVLVYKRDDCWGAIFVGLAADGGPVSVDLPLPVRAQLARLHDLAQPRFSR